MMIEYGIFFAVILSPSITNAEARCFKVVMINLFRSQLPCIHSRPPEVMTSNRRAFLVFDIAQPVFRNRARPRRTHQATIRINRILVYVFCCKHSQFTFLPQ